MKARRTSFEADHDLCFCSVDDDEDFAASVGDSLVTEYDRASNLGVFMGDSEGYLGKSGKSDIRMSPDQSTPTNAL